VPLILKRASTSRPSGQRSDSDFDVLADGGVVGRIMKAAAAPARTSWMWTLMFDCHEDRTPTRGYEPNALKCREHRGPKYDEPTKTRFEIETMIVNESHHRCKGFQSISIYQIVDQSAQGAFNWSPSVCNYGESGAQSCDAASLQTRPWQRGLALFRPWWSVPYHLKKP
jgi:hypothetical protein